MNDRAYTAGEKAETRNENECLRCHIREAEDIANKSRKELELAQKRIESLEMKIRFLEGKIDAYQYCLNCKQ